MIEGADRKDFLRKCVDRLTYEVEFLVYYGIDSKEINPPRSPKLSKFLHILNMLFICCGHYLRKKHISDSKIYSFCLMIYSTLKVHSFVNLLYCIL